MTGAIEKRFMLGVPDGRLDTCIVELEDALSALQRTPYHAVLGLDFLHHSKAVSRYMVDFHTTASAHVKIKAIYFEMNDFAFNTNRWFFSGFGYKKRGDLFDLDWLSEWDAETSDDFTLEGMESTQRAFATHKRRQRNPLRLELAEEIANHLVTARFMELVRAAHRAAKRRYPGLRRFPVFATVHGSDTASLSE